MATFIGVVLNKTTKALAVANWEPTWQEAYNKCKKQFPDWPCIALDFDLPPSGTGAKLVEFFQKNGVTKSDTVEALGCLYSGLQFLETLGSPVSAKAWLDGLGDKGKSTPPA